MIQVGNRVKIVMHYASLLNDYPIEVVEVSEAWAGSTRYKIELNIQGLNVSKWVDEDGIVLDIEYYRNVKLEKLLNE